MTHYKKQLAGIITYLMVHSIEATSPFFLFRSHTRNLVPTYALWENPSQPDATKVSGVLHIHTQWNNQFQKNNIAHSLFDPLLELGNQKELIPTLSFSGSKSDNRSPNAFLADYLYLPSDFESNAKVHPEVQSFMIMPTVRFNLDAWHKGIYIKCETAFVHMKAGVTLKETVIASGSNNHPAGYFTEDIVARPKLLDSATSYFSGNSIENQNHVIFEPLQYSRIDRKKKKNSMADTIITVGWDHLLSDNGHIGVAGHLTLPTGSRVKSRYLLEPIVGNGHHWELGGSIHGYWTAWHNETETHAFSLVGDIYCGHLFNCQQIRVFDLIDRPLSRYMLGTLFEQNTVSENTLATGPAGTTAVSVVPFRSAEHYLPIANVTTLPVDVSTSIQSELIGMAHYQVHNWSFNIGCNIWLTSREKIAFPTTPTFSIGLKGDAQMYGFADASSVVLSATQNKAQLTSGLRYTKQNNPTDLSVLQNKFIDTPALAVTQDLTDQQPPLPAAVGITYAPNADANNVDNLIYTSNPPVLLTMNDLDIESARTQGGSCKLFYNALYHIPTEGEWSPTIGIGSEIEWGHKKNNNHAGSRSTLSQWSIWINCSLDF